MIILVVVRRRRIMTRPQQILRRPVKQCQDGNQCLQQRRHGRDLPTTTTTARRRRGRRRLRLDGLVAMPSSLSHHSWRTLGGGFVCCAERDDRDGDGGTKFSHSRTCPVQGTYIQERGTYNQIITSFLSVYMRLCGFRKRRHLGGSTGIKTGSQKKHRRHDFIAMHFENTTVYLTILHCRRQTCFIL